MGRWITILLWLIWLTATLLAPSEAQAVRMPRGSFLIQPARSAAQLAKQVRTNPVVARRYARHFQVPAPEFAHYAQHQLGLRRLPRGGVFRVFFIRADGSIGSRVRYLPRGHAGIPARALRATGVVGHLRQPSDIGSPRLRSAAQGNYRAARLALCHSAARAVFAGTCRANLPP